MKIIQYVLLLSLLTNLACSSKFKTQLAAHKNILSLMASNPNASTEQRVDALAQSFATMMNESLGFFNPVKGAKYVKTYIDQNENSIDKIFKDIEAKQSNMNAVEQVVLGVKVAQKPYIKELTNIIPKFEKKYEQWSFILGLAGKVKRGLLGLFKIKTGSGINLNPSNKK